MNELKHKLEVISNRIAIACEKAGRDETNVRLLLATKTVPLEKIRMAIKAGCRLWGENKVQELREKGDGLKDLAPEVHFIGHLQSNKIKYVLKWASCIQSIDRLSIAEKLQHRLELEGREIDVFIQVNTSNESSKFGVHPEKAVELVQQVSSLNRIRIRGLMTIGLFSAETTLIRACFQILKKVQTEIQHLSLPAVTVEELSMGMSGDLEIAIEEGATIVRVGTAVFGARQYPDSYYWDELKND